MVMSLNKTKIEWADYTWSPVVGCKHGCSYCYAKRMNDRFKWIEEWDEPKFFWNRINEPTKLKKPSKIFVGSMCDLFGEWVQTTWINNVIKVAEENPQHTFQFLTKNPSRYLKFDFPDNCWLGTTITGWYKRQEENARIIHLMSNKNYKFVSIEPLLGKIDYNLSGIDLVIVGAMTGPNAVKPKKEWIDSIKHKNIFYKNNIKKYL